MWQKQQINVCMKKITVFELIKIDYFRLWYPLCRKGAYTVYLLQKSNLYNMNRNFDTLLITGPCVSQSVSQVKSMAQKIFENLIYRNITKLLFQLYKEKKETRKGGGMI